MNEMECGASQYMDENCKATCGLCAGGDDDDDEDAPPVCIWPCLMAMGDDVTCAKLSACDLTGCSDDDQAFVADYIASGECDLPGDDDDDDDDRGELRCEPWCAEHDYGRDHGGNTCVDEEQECGGCEHCLQCGTCTWDCLARGDGDECSCMADGAGASGADLCFWPCADVYGEEAMRMFVDAGCVDVEWPACVDDCSPCFEAGDTMCAEDCGVRDAGWACQMCYEHGYNMAATPCAGGGFDHEHFPDAGLQSWGPGNGWCRSELDTTVGNAATPLECWHMCEAVYGDRLVAVELNAWHGEGSCYCQDSCDCMADGGDSQYLITRDSIEHLPNRCHDDHDDRDDHGDHGDPMCESSATTEVWLGKTSAAIGPGEALHVGDELHRPCAEFHGAFEGHIRFSCAGSAHHPVLAADVSDCRYNLESAYFLVASGVRYAYGCNERCDHVCYEIYGTTIKEMHDSRVCFGAPTDEESCKACAGGPGAEPEPEPEECKDLQECPNPNPTKCAKPWGQKCQASCGLCPAEPEECSDDPSFAGCSTSNAQKCKNKESYKTKCRASCGLCPEECADDPSWAHCGTANPYKCKNKDSYKTKCRASCGLCGRRLDLAPVPAPEVLV